MTENLPRKGGTTRKRQPMEKEINEVLQRLNHLLEKEEFEEISKLLKDAPAPLATYLTAALLSCHGPMKLHNHVTLSSLYMKAAVDPASIAYISEFLQGWRVLQDDQ